MSGGQPKNEQHNRLGPLNAAICEEIRRKRAALGLTLRAIEEQTGIANNVIGKLEKNQMNVTPKYLEAFSLVFDCSPHDLLPPDATTIPLSMPERRLLDAIRLGDRTAALRAVADCLGLPAGDPELRPNPSAPLEVVDYLRSAASALTAAADALQLRNIP